MDNDSDSNDANVFREAMRDVKRLRCDEVVLPVSRPPPVPKQTLADARRVMDELLDHPYDAVEEWESGEELSYVRPGVQKRIWRKLRRGQYAVEAELDLHGMIVEAARQAVAEFVTRNIAVGHRCVRIIHGKGNRSRNRGPVLKGKVDVWLRRRDDVMAFCSARAVDGGTGAIYVLLRRSARSSLP